ncbi:MAG: hypothetical protein ABJL17_06880 [Parvibaculum sp.]|uniref:hypothetical protein n=1 Tax=Parvibaculum sp. TaxID=2024848 RepID=UPI003267C4AB
MKDAFDKAADPVAEVHARAKALEEHILYQSADAEAGDVVAGGYLARGRSKLADDPQGKAKRKDFESVATQALLDQIARIEAELADLYDQRDGLIDELNDIELRMERLRQIQDQIARGDMPELDADGELRDSELEALVAAHERKSGHSIDRSDPQALAAIIAAEQQDLAATHAEKREELVRTNERIGKLETELDSLQEGREADHASVDQTAEQRASLVAESRELIAERQTQSPPAKFDDFAL